jgi:methionyl-tRNA formyltransferase
MKILPDLCLFCSDSCRTRAYLSAMIECGLLPSLIINLKIPSIAEERDKKIFETSLFNNFLEINSFAESHGIKIISIETDNINDHRIINQIKSITQKTLIFSIPGQILGAAYFFFPIRYIHIHPGKLPDYRGSTPIYYSVLAERKIEATAIFLEKRIDEGAIIAKKEFPKPSNMLTIDLEYDPWIRAQLLKVVLSSLDKEKKLHTTSQTQIKGETYYIIHPVLKCLALGLKNS